MKKLWQEIRNKTKLISIKNVKPPHSVRGDDLTKFTDSLTKHGWSHRPLLGVRMKAGKVRLLTGSHRYAAAKAIGMKRIPVVVVEDWPGGSRYLDYAMYEVWSYSKVGTKLKEQGKKAEALLFSYDTRDYWY